MTTLGLRIAKLREEMGLTQGELADVLDISRASLSHYEKDRRMPDTVTLTRIAERLGVSLDYLVGRTNHPLVVLDSEVRELVEGLELSDAELLRRFALTVDGMKLTPAEARRFIAFIRAERTLNLE